MCYNLFMKINFDLKFYKVLTISLVIGLALSLFLNASLILERLCSEYMQNNYICKKFYGYPKDIVGYNNELNSNSLAKEEESISLSDCNPLYGSPEEIEKDIASNTPTINGYKIFIDCAHHIADKYPEKKDDYFGILDLKNNVKYYIETGENTLSSPGILGVKKDFIFTQYCYEGCHGIRMFNIKDVTSENFLRPVEISQILQANNIIDTAFLFLLNNRVVIIDENKIYDLNTDNFTVKILKEISADKMFGIYEESGHDFVADYKIEGNFIKYNIYNKKAVNVNFGSGLENKIIESGTLEIK